MLLCYCFLLIQMEVNYDQKTTFLFARESINGTDRFIAPLLLSDLSQEKGRFLYFWQVLYCQSILIAILRVLELTTSIRSNSSLRLCWGVQPPIR